jgi:arabinofuranosyltransferase
VTTLSQTTKTATIRRGASGPVGDLTRARKLAIFAVAALALAHALLFSGYLVDDTYISFRYARQLVSGHGLVYNLGERVEGYTNFSWVMIAAAGNLLGVPSTLSMPIVGLASLLLLIASVLRAGKRLHPNSIWSGIPAAAIVGCNLGVAFYSVTGLETVFFALWMTLSGLALIERRGVRFALFTSIAFLTRPEAGLLGLLGSASFLASALGGNRNDRAQMLRLLAVFTVIVGPYLLFKWTYFGALLPNTLSAKEPDLQAGLSYAVRSSWPLLGLVAVAAAGRRRHSRVLLLLWLVHVVAIVFEGGDWMEAGRLFVPYLPWLALAIDGEIVDLVAGPRSRLMIREMVCAGGLVLYMVCQMNDSARLAHRMQATSAADEQRAAVATYLRAQDVKTVAAYDIGLLGYLLPTTTVIDLGGLVDREVGSSPGGYGTKRPSTEYLERRAPERVLFASDAPRRDAKGELRAVPLFGVESYVQRSRWFNEHYRYAASFAIAPRYQLHVFARRVPRSKTEVH